MQPPYAWVKGWMCVMLDGGPGRVFADGDNDALEDDLSAGGLYSVYAYRESAAWKGWNLRSGVKIWHHFFFFFSNSTCATASRR
jgi:hypothetical protein